MAAASCVLLSPPAPEDTTPPKQVLDRILPEVSADQHASNTHTDELPDIDRLCEDIEDAFAEAVASIARRNNLVSTSEELYEELYTLALTYNGNWKNVRNNPRYAGVLPGIWKKLIKLRRKRQLKESQKKWRHKKKRRSASTPLQEDKQITDFNTKRIDALLEFLPFALDK
tara:strand:- start:180 stop:692 length:513 start_codon:yes stop_codon:yes gene_type:complete